MNDVIIVTGGASGLGFAISKLLVKQQYNIALIGRKYDSLSNAKLALKSISDVDVVIYNGDISDEIFVSNVYTNLSKQYIIRYLFNCAGKGIFCKPEYITNYIINEIFSGSLIGLMLMSSYAIKYMKHTYGFIISILSTAALKGNDNESAYCAAKWGARGFIESIRMYIKNNQLNIQTISIYPGGINTQFWGSFEENKPDITKFMDPSELAEEIISAVFNKRTLMVTDLVINRSKK